LGMGAGEQWEPWLRQTFLVALYWQHKLDIDKRPVWVVYWVRGSIWQWDSSHVNDNHNVRGMTPPLVGMLTRQAGWTVLKVVISICVFMLCCAATGWIIFRIR
jgi:hypothetical protein